MVVRLARLLLTLLPATLLAALFVAAPSSAQAATAPCDPAIDVVVTVDFAELDGESSTMCVSDADGRSAVDALSATGVTIESTSGASPMVCRIDGQPAPGAETCASTLSGDGYWAFYVAAVDGEWGYAQVGPAEHTVAAGDLVAFVYTPLSQTSPALPEVDTSAAAFASVASVDGAETGDTEQRTDEDEPKADEDSSVTWQLGVGILAVVLVAAAAVLVGRRKRGGA